MNRYKELDKLFSQYIRMRAMVRVGGCEKCFTPKHDILKDNGKVYPAWQQLDCAHFWPRRMLTVRFSPENAAGLCSGCHRYLDDNAMAKVAWFKSHLGNRDFEMLEIRASKPLRKMDFDENAVYLWLTQQIGNWKERSG